MVIAVVSGLKRETHQKGYQVQIIVQFGWREREVALVLLIVIILLIPLVPDRFISLNSIWVILLISFIGVVDFDPVNGCSRGGSVDQYLSEK
jgi:hypothetical protein